MANHPGALSPDVLYAKPGIAPDFLPYAYVTEADGWLDGGYVVGTKTSTQPVTENPVHFTGHMGGGFADDFYNRILVEPGRLDVGNLVSDQSRQISVFNGFLEQKTLDNLLLAGGDGISVSGPATPATLNPLQTTAYTVTLAVEGPAVIDADLTFDFEDGVDDVTVDIVGARIVVLPYQPEAPWSETLEWRTSVLTSNDGTEQRSRLRKKGRQSFRGTYPVPKDEMGRAVNTVYGWLQRRWAVAVWSESQYVGTISAGSNELPCVTGTSDIRVGSTVAVWESARKNEVIEVSEIESGLIRFDRPLLNDYVRALVMPCRIGKVQGNIQRSTNGHTAKLAIAYDVIDNVEVAGPVPEQYAGEDVYWDPALLSEGGDIGDSYSARVDVVDYGGALDMFAPWVNNRTARPYRLVKEGPAETWALRQFLHRRAGRWRPFWLPTFESDLRLNMTGLVTTSVQVEDDDYRALGSKHAHVGIQYVDGSWRARAITGISVQGGGLLLLALDGAALNVDASQIRMLSFLGLKRLDTDRVEIRWPGNGVATCDVRILEYEP